MISLRYYFFSRLVAIVFCQILICVVIGWSYINGEMLQQHIDKGFDDLKSINKNISYFYFHQLEEISRLSQRPNFSPTDIKQSQKLIKDYLEVRGLITTAHFYSLNGDLKFTVKSDGTPPYRAEENYRKSADKNFVKYVDEVIKNKKITLTHPLYTRSHFFYHVGLVPIFKKGTQQLDGILSVAFFPHLNPITQSLTGLSLNSKNILILTDRDANIIATSGVEKEDVTSAIKHFVEHRGGTSKSPFKYKRKNVKELTYTIKNNNYFFTSHKVKDAPFVVILGLNKNIIDRELEQLIKMLVIVLAFSTIIGLFFAILFSKKVSREINTLVYAVKSLKLGTFKLVRRSKMQKDFTKALDEVEDLSIEIEKGRLLGNLWGQESSFMDENDS